MKVYNGFSFLDGLQLLFIGLKLREDIDWSWWIVCMPFVAIAALAILSVATGGRK